MSGRVVVVGGGWAGMSAARELAQNGASVTLFERQSYVGGRAFSFFDPATGRVLDNGQHVLLGCCAETVRLLRDIGQADAVKFQEALEIPVFADGVWTRLYSHPRFRGPTHLLPGLVGYRALSLSDRVRAMAIGLRMLQLRDRQALDRRTFAEWLRQHGQSETAIERLWDLVGVSVLNCHADQLSAFEALNAFAIGVLPGHEAARLGFFVKPLADLAAALRSDLEAKGVSLHLGTAVKGLMVQSGRVTGVRVQDHVVPAARVIAAVPHDALGRMVPSGASVLLPGFEWSGILNWYLRFAEPVWQGTVFALADAPSPFVFNRGRIFDPGGADDGRLLAVSVSDSPMAPGDGRRALIAQLRRTLAEALPAINEVKLLGDRVVVQPHATFRARPGSAGARPQTRTGVEGLYLAGDWTASGWPASLEGAVRSGQSAAAAVLADEAG